MAKVLVTGGAGYVGCVLSAMLVERGHEITVVDTMYFGDAGLDSIRKDARIVRGDIRDDMTPLLRGQEAVLHLAAISNDPSSDLAPELTQQTNYDAVVRLVKTAKKEGVSRFVNVSTSSVYGVKETPNVTEDLPLDPLTIYSRTKAEAEKAVHAENSPDFCAFSLRPATVCGWSPRMRLDLTVNILTMHAVLNKRIRVFGGAQKRPNIHIWDICDYYEKILKAPAEKLGGQAFNAGYENHTVMEIAQMVKQEVGDDVSIATEPTDDPRSYHISSEKIKRVLGYEPRRTLRDAIRDVAAAFRDGRIKDSSDVNYYNVKKMKLLAEKGF
ncbi:MAG: UDP-glucose 4-epimerase [Omnitrophica bacterium RIFOXYB12_FULL_50_7]|nr:MAG: UDP-glucose 4-epimerase [Omnitrophica bacterium RIFOXYB12_FULL_50_7]